jgi:hypothetical protein
VDFSKGSIYYSLMFPGKKNVRLVGNKCVS